jgi:primosomal protein N' (replication factor Y)
VERYCRVAIDSPVLALDRPFDYAIPDRLIGRVHVGSVVRVVLHGRSMRAFVTDLLDAPAVDDPRPLRSIVAPEPVFGRHELTLARWAADRYVASMGHVLHDAVPGRFSAPMSTRSETRQLLPRSEVRWLGGGVRELIDGAGSACIFPPTLRDEAAVAAHVAGEAAALGGRTLVICPRVDLVESVAAQIPGAVVVHGAERPRDRAQAWAAARDGHADVVVGGRSALLVPLRDMRAVCVLSAHDRSLKSERAPRLHAGIAARHLAEIRDAAFFASSPSPPVELAASPDVRWMVGERADIRTEIARPRGGPVTVRLIEMVRWAIERRSDALVFVGRRGRALRLRCRDCGWTPACERCGSGLAEGAASGRLECRVCGASAATPTTCVSCGGALVSGGWGHERVARALETSGLGAPIVRMVRGEVPAERPHPAVLVGTLAAVHAADNVGCVCVADLDQLLARPDFRAGERALQTLHELAGTLRPGGRFLVQTREPEHHAVQAFARRSYRFFVDRELVFRKETSYPPFGELVRVETSPESAKELERVVRSAGAQTVGGLERRGRWGTLIRTRDLEPLLAPLRAFASAHARTRIDVDPVDVL